ncbi:MAG: glycosyltransferase [Acidobacteria bacterium]|nr:glycosyltransferase [Acidobacteriota bacterium]
MAESLGELAVLGRRLCEPLTGVGRYLEKLLEHWALLEHPFERICVYAPGEPRLSPAALAGRNTVCIIPQKVSPMVWEHVQLPTRLRAANLLFSPYTLPWTLAGRGVVSNLGIYDGRPGDFPLLARLRTTPFFRHSARRALAVLANSGSTRDDLIEHYQVSPAKIEVILLGADERLSPGSAPEQPLPDQVRRRYGLPAGPFFLFVGKISKRRNIPLLVESFARAARAHDLPQRLVIVGPDAWGVNPLGLAQRHGVGDRVCWIQHVPMDDLLHFYRAARAFVLPTEHEGFSLTIVEAMACGLPALVFDHAALQGPVRAAVHLVGPLQLADALAEIARSAELYARQREAGLRCAYSYRWKTTAEATMRSLVRAACGLVETSR